MKWFGRFFLDLKLKFEIILNDLILKAILYDDDDDCKKSHCVFAPQSVLNQCASGDWRWIILENITTEDWRLYEKTNENNSYARCFDSTLIQRPMAKIAP